MVKKIDLQWHDPSLPVQIHNVQTNNNKYLMVPPFLEYTQIRKLLWQDKFSLPSPTHSSALMMKRALVRRVAQAQTQVGFKSRYWLHCQLPYRPFFLNLKVSKPKLKTYNHKLGETLLCDLQKICIIFGPEIFRY